MSKTSRTRRALGLVCVAGIVAAGCGGDDDDAAATTAASTAAAGATVTTVGSSTAPATSEGDTATSEGGAATTAAGPVEPGAPFVLGAIGSYTGPVGLPGAREGVESWAKAVNDAGGINGHMIDLKIADDTGDPAVALTAAKKMVEEDGIIAFIGQQSSAKSGWFDYATEQKIPVIGGLDVGEGDFVSNPNFLAVGGAYSLISDQIVEFGAAQGATKLGWVTCSEVPSCETQANKVSEAADTADGIELAFLQRVPGTLPDYSAVCLAAQEAGIDALSTALGSPTTIAVYEACDQQGLDVKKFGIGSSLSNDFLASPSLEGYNAIHIVFPFSDSSVPATEEFQKVMAEYAPEALSAFSASGYAAGKMFEAAVKAGDLGDGATSADVFEAFYAIPAGETLGGLVPPMTYEAGKNSVSECYFIQQIQDGEFTTPQGLELSCSS